MSQSPGLLGTKPHNLVRRRLQVQCTKPPLAFHRRCQGKVGSPLLEVPQKVAALWSSPLSHRQLNEELSHQLLVLSARPHCQHGWSEHAIQPLLPPSRVHIVDLTRRQCKGNLKLMLMRVSLVPVQGYKDHNPSMTHDIIPRQIFMACHHYRKVLSIGMVLRDTAFTILPDKGVTFSGTLLC